MADEQAGTTEPHIDDQALADAEEQVAGVDERYEPGARPTVTLPGTDGMVSGTAFAEMVDDNGELKDNRDCGDNTASANNNSDS